MRRFLTAGFAVTAIVAVSACGMNMGRVKAAAAGEQTKKDCAACEKMCAVAANAEKNPTAVDSCKADCKKTCQ